MKLKGKYFFTLRENAKDEESTSGNLLVRAGYTKKVGAGIYMYLPLGYKALNNIMKIVKDSQDKLQFYKKSTPTFCFEILKTIMQMKLVVQYYGLQQTVM